MTTDEIYLSSIATIIGLVGLGFTYLQYNLNTKKRKDDLFNLRFAFYKKLCSAWIKTHHESNNTLDVIDLIIFTEESRFLFGKEITEHIHSLHDKRASNPFMVDNFFSAPFDAYLNLNK
jgi:hypothetical protein